MKILFSSEKERHQFLIWLRSIQDYVQEIEMCNGSPKLFDSEVDRISHLKMNGRYLWYRVYDVDEEMCGVIDQKV